MKLMPESLLKIMFLLLMQWEAWAMNKDLLRVICTNLLATGQSGNWSIKMD